MGRIKTVKVRLFTGFQQFRVAKNFFSSLAIRWKWKKSVQFSDTIAKWTIYEKSQVESFQLCVFEALTKQLYSAIRLYFLSLMLCIETRSKTPKHFFHLPSWRKRDCRLNVLKDLSSKQQNCFSERRAFNRYDSVSPAVMTKRFIYRTLLYIWEFSETKSSSNFFF